MRIGITGTTGFLGRHLKNSLLPKYQLTELNRNFIKECIEGNELSNIDVIVHCAARAHVMNEVSTDPWEHYYQSNVKLTVDLAKSSAKKNVKRFIFISSLKVNGERTSLAPFRASDKKNPTDDYYAKSKAIAEEELIQIGHENSMDIVIIRPPLIYGDGVKANFASLFSLASKRLPIPLGGINNNQRSLVSVDAT